MVGVITTVRHPITQYVAGTTNNNKKHTWQQMSISRESKIPTEIGAKGHWQCRPMLLSKMWRDWNYSSLPSGHNDVFKEYYNNYNLMVNTTNNNSSNGHNRMIDSLPPPSSWADMQMMNFTWKSKSHHKTIAWSPLSRSPIWRIVSAWLTTMTLAIMQTSLWAKRGLAQANVWAIGSNHGLQTLHYKWLKRMLVIASLIAKRLFDDFIAGLLLLSLTLSSTSCKG